MLQSLPSWERGLKFRISLQQFDSRTVAPLVGAWIEMPCAGKREYVEEVAPLVGAWIEIVRHN